jgi:tetratricopeptide (TPR) repeat protein
MRSLGLCALAVLLGGCPPGYVRDEATISDYSLPSDAAVLAQKAEEKFQEGDRIAMTDALVILKKLVSLDPGKYESLWRAARAAFWVADLSPDEKNRRAKFAHAGIDYAKRAIAANPKGVEGHYYLALTLGYLASTKSFGAVGLVPDVAKSAKVAAELDEKYEHCGPRRLLAGVYTRAPGWPASIGDVDEGLTHAKRSVELCPDFPPNHFFYAEALIANGRIEEAQQEIDKAEALPPPTESPWSKHADRWQNDLRDLKQKLQDKH